MGYAAQTSTGFTVLESVVPALKYSPTPQQTYLVGLYERFEKAEAPFQWSFCVLIH